MEVNIYSSGNVCAKQIPDYRETVRGCNRLNLDKDQFDPAGLSAYNPARDFEMEDFDEERSAGKGRSAPA
jgi:hypothetical protein